MGTIRTISGVLVACFAFAQVAVAQPPASAKDAVPAQAKVRAEMHRAIADLIDARSAEKPDQAKIDALGAKVQRLRGEIAPPPAAGPGRAWGGPGRGPCAAWGGGPGYGRGPGWGGGRGMGWGAGYGWGFVDANQNGVCDRFEAVTGQR